ncbi:NAD(P)/FAD-dependent oxidoreductase [Chitinophaga sedimenti]|uniref:phytoene desaturase family protein n=1 Tax=Chitinophaga sedimenti TaxID=2033606 RepID=UPI0020043792|nr:NAD(P)/FAD-dependent oxidoreductase [Chitinophaga sedimenti]MCK7560125.1 NAD(P)/FAD-dependent oxidoreductase [Chitinophaga sedimenti]
MRTFDVVIIGSGLGGLVCGAILSKHGYRVCILEKNQQTGGCLQTFSRDKVLFDSGVHYIGSLDKGQSLYKIFSYLGIMDKLKVQRLDDAFDRIIFDGDPVEYTLEQGYDKFIAGLVSQFPQEEKAILQYCAAIKDTCACFPLYNLRCGTAEEKQSVLGINAKDFIDKLTDNPRLRQVLAGNNLLYAGVPDKTPFYVHALITNSYIESSRRCVNGGSQLAKQLGRVITDNGGVIERHKEVIKITEENRVVSHVTIAGGEQIGGKHFISNVHPVKTLELLDSDMIRGAYRTRLTGLENSISSLMLNIALKPGSFPYYNYNLYLHESSDVWAAVNYTEDTWPGSLGVYFQHNTHNEGFSDGISVVAYMRYEEVAKWADTYNVVSHETARGADYEAFKQAKAEKIISILERRFPELRSAMRSYTVATPLTFRDYMGTGDGSIYGILKDSEDPMRTLVSPRTRIPNLYLTGQNLNLHGIRALPSVRCSQAGNWLAWSNYWKRLTRHKIGKDEKAQRMENIWKDRSVDDRRVVGTHHRVGYLRGAGR